ncbi:MAG TPA: methyltransferase domain-containing protein [Acidimicrobiales bacterium]|nr:methyltransferase domain-containing protein [Acidimicrobiales bacterium]
MPAVPAVPAVPAAPAESGADLRLALVDHLRRRGHLRDPRIAAAFAAVPRELFVPDHARRHGLAAVYRDEPVVTRRDPASGRATSSSSQPAVMAVMLEMLGARPGQRILEVGAGTGWNAALLAHLVGDAGAVTAVELDREVAAGARDALLAAGSPARVVAGDGRAGWAEGAPYDAVIVTASSESVPRAWFDQLTLGGRLVVPLRLSRAAFSLQVVAAFRKVRHGFDPVAASRGGFMALRGGEGHGEAARIVAAEAADGHADHPLVEFAGPALAGLDAAGRRRLLLAALGFGRAEALEVGAAAAADLAAYVALALPEERLVEVTRGGRRQALGILDVVDGSLALLAVTASGARLERFGGGRAMHALRSTVEQWELAGRPGLGRARLMVRYGAVRPHGWRSVRRGDQWISLEWHPQAGYGG